MGYDQQLLFAVCYLLLVLVLVPVFTLTLTMATFLHILIP